MNIPKYGMKYSTIEFWQRGARGLWMRNAIVLGKERIWNSSYMQQSKSVDIAHSIIAMAEVLKPMEIKRILNGQN